MLRGGALDCLPLWGGQVKPDELKEILARPGYTIGHASFVPHYPRTPPLLEPDLRDGALGASRPKGKHSARFLVRVTSFRVRLLDEDNLCEKYHVDCCRYAGLIPGDAPGQAKIETGQQKVQSKKDECVLIEISPL